MRRVRYQVAMSLDGFIAGPNGEHDWIVADEFRLTSALLMAEFDTAVMGRKTHEVVKSHGGEGEIPGLEAIVFSRSLPPAEHPGVRITGDDPASVVRKLKAAPGKDIWLYGGSNLARTLFDAGLVDTVEVAVVPIVLGEGISLLSPGASSQLQLADQRVRFPTAASFSWHTRSTEASPSRPRFATSNRASRSSAPHHVCNKPHPVDTSRPNPLAC